MSTTSENVSATLAGQAVSLESKADSIAALLTGEEEELLGDDKDDENLSDASTQDDDDDSNDELEATGDDEEGTPLEEVAADDTTWEGTLGVSEGDLSFDEDGNITGFNTKVNGEIQTIGAKDLIAGYQNNKANTAKAQAHAEMVKDFEVKKGEIEQVYSSRLASVDALSAHFEKELVAEFDGVDWNQLRVDNPAEYAALRHDFSAKAGELQKIKDAIESDKSTQNQELMQSNQDSNKAYLKGQFDTMIENNPEWADEPTLTKARKEYKTFTEETYGFKPAEFDSVFDARLIELIKDAKAYHEGKKVAEKKMKKPVPKFQKSRGKGVKPRTSKLEKLTAASRNATGENKRNLQQSAVAELLLGGS